MASGGARNRSGPQSNPESDRSAKRGLKLDALPNEGRNGAPPIEWPLGSPAVYIDVVVNGKPSRELDLDATADRQDAELSLWEEVWTYPQACAWELDRWRWNIVALYVRTFLVCAGPEAKAADKSSLHRFGDQLGLTPAGLKENGWAIARPEISVSTADETPKASAPAGGSSARERRLKAVGS